MALQQRAFLVLFTEPHDAEPKALAVLANDEHDAMTSFAEKFGQNRQIQGMLPLEVIEHYRKMLLDFAKQMDVSLVRLPIDFSEA